MPKAASNHSHSLPNGTSHPNVLKRNQACHQCRKRKLKCDAKRPCSTCKRSHAHALSHAAAGVVLPPEPECTFDDIAEASIVAAEAPPKNRYEKLENRINELEAMLQRKDSGAPASGYTRPPLVVDPNLAAVIPQAPPPSDGALASPMEKREPYSAVVPDGDKSFSSSPPQSAYITGTSTSPSPSLAVKPVDPSNYRMIWSNWPPHLPQPDLLRHLVDIFFAFHPNAGRLLHTATFQASIMLPPNHPKFPMSPLLHAICAVASMYTAAVTSPPLPNLSEGEPDEIFNQKHRVRERRPDSFAEQQAKLAKSGIEEYQNMGMSLLQCLQATIVLSWYHWCHAKWVEVFTTSAMSLRVTVPLGLNVCPPFLSITKSLRQPSILPPARTVIEDETRRNTFWLAYAMERMHGSGNGWALSLDDQDVTQLMPVRGDQFDQGLLVTPHERQWACTKDLLLTHPEDQTDSFILYIKGTILISRVKNFNLRFRTKYFTGDASVAATPPTGENASIDPRITPAFKELDHLISNFRSSFPSHLKDPIINNVVDSHLYTTCLIPHIATILLHEPHAHIRSTGCISALKILTAARATLDLIYVVWSTSFDITLLDLFCTYCWFMAGRILVRFLQAAMDANSQEQITPLRAELDFVRLAVRTVGQRIPLAFRYARMLDDLAVKHCTPATTTNGVINSVPTIEALSAAPATLEAGLPSMGAATAPSPPGLDWMKMDIDTMFFNEAQNSISDVFLNDILPEASASNALTNGSLEMGVGGLSNAMPVTSPVTI